MGMFLKCEVLVMVVIVLVFLLLMKCCKCWCSDLLWVLVISLCVFFLGKFIISCVWLKLIG